MGHNLQLLSMQLTGSGYVLFFLVVLEEMASLKLSLFCQTPMRIQW